MDMHDEIIFSSRILEVIGSQVCILVDAAVAKQAKAAFKCCGEWYIPERAATLKRYDEHWNPLYSTKAR